MVYKEYSASFVRKTSRNIKYHCKVDSPFYYGHKSTELGNENWRKIQMIEKLSLKVITKTKIHQILNNCLAEPRKIYLLDNLSLKLKN